MPGPDLVVLVRVEVLLLLAGGVLGLARSGLGRSGSSLGRLLGVLLALLLALLQLRLGDALARDLVQVQVGDLLGGRHGSRRVSHGGRVVVVPVRLQDQTTAGRGASSPEMLFGLLVCGREGFWSIATTPQRGYFFELSHSFLVAG